MKKILFLAFVLYACNNQSAITAISAPTSETATSAIPVHDTTSSIANTDETPSQSGYIFTFGSRLRIRKSPELTAPIVGTISEAGTLLPYEGVYHCKTRYESPDCWYQITFQGDTGWVSAKYSRPYIAIDSFLFENDIYINGTMPLSNFPQEALKPLFGKHTDRVVEKYDDMEFIQLKFKEATFVEIFQYPDVKRYKVAQIDFQEYPNIVLKHPLFDLKYGASEADFLKAFPTMNPIVSENNSIKYYRKTYEYEVADHFIELQFKDGALLNFKCTTEQNICWH